MRSIIPISLFIFLFASIQGFSVESDSVSSYQVHSRYHHENNPWFKFGTFKRGFDSKELKLVLDSLESKPRRVWSRHDSLTFARTSLQTGNTALSDYYFNAIDVNFDSEKDFWYDHITIHVINGDYQGGIDLLHKAKAGIIEFTPLYFYLKILEAKINYRNDPKWFKTNKVLDWKVDSTLFSMNKNSDEFEQKFIKPLRNLEFVLKNIIHYVHEDDHTLAMTCFEMGQILEFHVSLTQSYIAYSLGRHYNKRDKELLNETKHIKAKLMKKNYKIPIFRKYFPRIEYWRFDYNVLKEKVILEKNDTIKKVYPDLMQPKENKDIISFPKEYIVLGGLFLMIIAVIFFLKTKGKN